MNRRKFIATAGLAATAPLTGCLGSSTPTAANEYDYETNDVEGTAVPLVPTEDAIDWYRDEDRPTLFVDARDATAYEQARVPNAVLSPAPDGKDTNDPVQTHDTDTRIVTYCVCPHHLSSLRASTLITNGYVHTYALKEGLNGWYSAGHPVEGQSIEEGERPDTYEITGTTSSEYAGEFAWARHEPSGQREAAPIADDGTFSLHIQFYEITPESELTVETPAGSVTDTLAALTESELAL